MERMRRKKATPEMIEKINQHNRERTCRWKLLNNFGPGDYFTLLTYRKEKRPADMIQAKKDFEKFYKKVGKEYRKRGQELKWIRNIEAGTKNGWHIHVVLNRIPDTDLIIQEAWPHGKAVSQLMHEAGNFRQLAAYLTKAPKTDKRLRETSYSTSRNLPVPEPQKKTYLHWKTWKKVRIPKGFTLEKETYVEGINPVTGYPYRSYTLIREKRRE